LKESLASGRVVAEPARMLSDSERNLAEAVIVRIASRNMAMLGLVAGAGFALYLYP
jgi:hypothetical protein